MLSNISDFLSLLSLLAATIYAFRIFVLSFINREKDDKSISRLQLIRDYLDNDEE